MVLTEDVGSAIRKITDVINSIIKKLVESFNSLMEKTKINKLIKDLKKLPKGASVKTTVDYKTAAKTYVGLLDSYGKAVLNPNKDIGLEEKTENAKKTRKAIILTSAIVVPVSAVIGYLELLKHKNNYKNYLICKAGDEYLKAAADSTKNYDKLKSAVLDSKKYDATTKSIRRNIKKMEDRADFAYSNYQKAQKAIQESEKFRLILYKDLVKSAKSIISNVKATFVYGLKDIKDKNKKITNMDLSESKYTVTSVHNIMDELFDRDSK